MLAIAHTHLTMAHFTSRSMKWIDEEEGEGPLI